MVFMKKIFYLCILLLFSSYSYAKDLTGNVIDCDIEQGEQEFFTVEFLSKKKAKFSMAKFRHGDHGGGLKERLYFLVRNEVVRYHVKEKFIILSNGHLKKTVNGVKFGGYTSIRRSDLKLLDGGHLIYIGPEYIKGIRQGCRLIDANGQDLHFKKYDEFDPPTKYEGKKIL
jgi:hypothetical protein|tara:strand:+ start:152 stop:664 length:513 start_codon:yes stop_codon:yes gene_type:complete